MARGDDQRKDQVRSPLLHHQHDARSNGGATRSSVVNESAADAAYGAVDDGEGDGNENSSSSLQQRNRTTMTDSATSAATGLAAQRIVLSTMFAMFGFIFGYFQSQVAVTKENLRITDAHFGLLLLFDDIGSFTGQAIAMSPFSHHLRSRPQTLAPILGALAALSMNRATSAYVPAQFSVALLINGVASSLFDIAINIQIVKLGTQSSKTEAPFFHGIMSGGQCIGSLVGMLLTRLHVPFSIHVPVTGLALGAAYVLHWPLIRYLIRWPDDLSHASEEQQHQQHQDVENGGADASDHVRRQRWRSVTLLALLGGLSSIGEGGTPEWSGIYLRQDLRTSFDVANTAALACAAGMTIARLAHGPMSRMFSVKTIISAGPALSALSIVFGLVFGKPYVFLWAVAFTGAGLANVTPLSMAMLSAIPDAEEQARAVTRLSIAQNVGFFSGPPVIGAFSGLVGLRLAFGGVISLTSLMITVMSALFLRTLV